MEEKLQRLKKIISDLESVIVAFSGGVDSTFLLKVAYDVLGENSIALTAVSPSYPAFELQEARELAKNIGVRHMTENSHELDIPGYAENSPRRCFFCKTELFDICFAKANELGIKNVIYGATLSDLGDFRAGMGSGNEKIARIEIDESEFEKLLSRNLREIISKRLKELGFTYITIDIEGYRSGSMNELLIK